MISLPWYFEMDPVHQWIQKHLSLCPALTVA